MTIVAGHFDHHMEGTLLGYELLPPETKAKSRLIVGGWNHGFQTTPQLPGLQHDHDINIDLDTFEWMYSLLVEEKEPEHEVLVYAIGEDKWLSLEEWPSSVSASKILYLDGASLCDSPARDTQSLAYDYDPSHPVLSVGGETLFNSNARKGSQPRQPHPYRHLLFRLSQYSIHSNYPGVWAEQTAIRTAHQKVWTGQCYPSRIELPLLQ